jgi:trimethylamine--corrinoid protein Co-methyltransferase
VENNFRKSVMVKPFERLDQDQINLIHKASMAILEDPGLWVFNERAAKLLESNGAKVWEEFQGITPCWRVSLKEGMVKEGVAQAPSKVTLGARNPENKLILDVDEPRTYFGSGSESNVWLETEIEEFASTKDPSFKIKAPVHKELRGNTALLARAAHICEHLENLDFFIRPVNIQDPEINSANHDVNKFFASLNNITKHVQAGLTELDSFDHVMEMAELVAGGKEALAENPVISFITCVIKSPLQVVEDTADKLFRICERGAPVVISSSPQGGSTAPIQEAGMVAQINAEVLAGILLTQLINPGTPAIYGAVPVRARMDDLHDLYGCPEFNQYNVDCVQMARHYRIPVYSSAGVGDAKAPGMQATFEKVFTHTYVSMSAANYIHYAFGLLDRTNTFSPVQAILDDEQISKAKHCHARPLVNDERIEDVLKTVRKVMASSNRLYARHARKPIQAGEVSTPYRYGTKDTQDRVLEKALERLAEIEATPGSHMDKKTVETIYERIPGILPGLKQWKEQ